METKNMLPNYRASSAALRAAWLIYKKTNPMYIKTMNLASFAAGWNAAQPKTS